MEINWKALFTAPIRFFISHYTLFCDDSFSMVCFLFAIDLTILHVIPTLRWIQLNDDENV